MVASVQNLASSCLGKSLSRNQAIFAIVTVVALAALALYGIYRCVFSSSSSKQAPKKKVFSLDMLPPNPLKKGELKGAVKGLANSLKQSEKP